MAQNVAHDFEVGSCVNLPRGMAMPKRMRTDDLGRDPSLLRIVPNAVTDAAASQLFIRHVRPQENVPCLRGSGPLSFYISRHCFGDLRQ